MAPLGVGEGGCPSSTPSCTGEPSPDCAAFGPKRCGDFGCRTPVRAAAATPVCALCCAISALACSWLRLSSAARAALATAASRWALRGGGRSGRSLPPAATEAAADATAADTEPVPGTGALSIPAREEGEGAPLCTGRGAECMPSTLPASLCGLRLSRRLALAGEGASGTPSAVLCTRVPPAPAVRVRYERRGTPCFCGVGCGMLFCAGERRLSRGADADAGDCMGAAGWGVPKPPSGDAPGDGDAVLLR